MPYQLISGGPISLLRSRGEIKTQDGQHVIGQDHEAILRWPGEVVEDEDVSPVVVQLYDDGDDHVRSILKRISKTQAEVAAKDFAEPEPHDPSQPRTMVEERPIDEEAAADSTRA